jgi:MFS family permease
MAQLTSSRPEPTPFSNLPGGLAPLGYRNYLLYWIGFAVSNTGRWIELTGSLWLVYSLTSSPVLLGGLGIARAAPAIILSPIAGVVADRVDQRRMLFATQAVSLVLSLAIGLLVLTGRVQVWHLYLQLAIQAAVQAFDAAVRQALFPRLVPRSSLPEAVTLTVTAARAAKFIGPAVGGLAIAYLGTASPYLLNAASFLVLMAAVVGMRGVRARRARGATTFRSDLREGLGYIVRAPVLSGIMKLEIAFGVLQMNDVMITIVALQLLHAGPQGLGLLLSAPALGSIVGVVLVLVLGQARRQGRFVVYSMLAYVVAMLAVAVSPAYALTLVALAFVGLLDSIETVTRHSIMQLGAPGRMRGRVMANMATVTNGVGPLAQTQSGVLAAVLGPPFAIVASAVALAGATLITARASPALWNFSRDDAAEPAATDTAAAARAVDTADVATSASGR